MQFQSTLPRRERRLSNPRSAPPLYVSIHAPAKGATRIVGTLYPACTFQSTLPRRERPRLNTSSTSVFSFQSTLPRRERQMVAKDLGTDTYVSIHAPAKGATYSYHLSYTTLSSFNPRSREGSDPPIPDHGVSSVLVSIHAPAKGATAPCPGNSSRSTPCFNPRSREGSDSQENRR